MPRFRADLEAAGISYIDTKGEYADFHSLRKTFGTMLTLAGVGQRTVRELMRHSDMRLTAKTYTDAICCRSRMPLHCFLLLRQNRRTRKQTHKNQLQRVAQCLRLS